MEMMNEVQQITVSKEDWDKLVAHRDELENIVKVKEDKILSMQRIIDQQAVAADNLETRFESLANILGISSLKNRVSELEAKLEDDDDAPLTKRWVRDAIEDALENFDVEDALFNGYKSYLTTEDIDPDDVVLKSELRDAVRDAVSDLTFTVDVS